MRSDVLVIGATGTVGEAAAKQLVWKGAKVRALVRSEKSAARLGRGVEACFGDLRDPASLSRAVQGARAVFFVAPHEADEETLAASVIAACEAARARLVFVGVHADGGSRPARWLQRQVYGRVLPHYRPKFRLSERVRQSGCDPVVLIPTNFFQNDELFRPEILAGRFPQPFEKPVNRVDVRDIGVAAARALTDFSVKAGAWPVVGPASVTGEECAAVWSRALGTPVEPERDQAKVSAAISRALDGKKREDFVASYAILRKFALPTGPKQLAMTEALLGRAPTSYESWVSGVASSWRAPAAHAA